MKFGSESIPRWSVAGLVAAAVACGCANTTQLQNSQMSMREMIANDQQQIASLQDKVGELNDRLSELQHNGGGAQSGGGSSNPAVNAKIAKLESEIAALQAGQAVAPAAGTSDNATDNAAPAVGTGAAGGAGAAAAATAGAAASDNGVAPDIAAGANGTADTLGSADTTAPVGVPVAPAPSANSAPTVAPSGWRNDLNRELSASATSSEPGAKVYRAGLSAMQQSNYRNAVVLLAQFQHAYPKSSLGEPAEYFSANALYESGKYDQSVLQFNDLVMRYPRGRYASAALLREAQAFEKLNDRIDARLTLQKLVSDHPDSPEAASANAMMQNLAND